MEGEVFIGFVTNAGILTMDRKPAFAAHLKSFAGQEVEVIVRERRFVRSLPQNRYYWGVVVKGLSEHTGYPPNDMHEVLKQHFLPKHLVFMDNNGIVKNNLVIGGTTTKLTVQEFMTYLADIQRNAAEGLFGEPLQIPDPNEPIDAPIGVVEL